RGQVVRGEAVWLEPDAHREGARTLKLRLLDAGDRRQLRLDDAGEVVGDLALVEHIRVHRDVHRRGAAAFADLDDRVLGALWQLPAQLVDLGRDLGERLVRLLVEAQVRGDRRDALRRARGHEIDAVGGRDLALQRRGNEAVHQV